MLILISLFSLAAPLFEMAPAQIDAYLPELNARQCEYGARVAGIAKLALGTPYAGDPLGEGPGAPYDDDPMMDLSRADCVTFVEQVLALAAADSYQDAFDTLQQIRYGNGEAAFENRNHFMIADWVANNTFCKDVTGKLGVTTEKVTRTVGKKHFFTLKKLQGFAASAGDPEITLEYAPAASAAEAGKNLPSPALILLIGKVDWLFTLHCGLYIRDETGAGLFYNASSKQGKVVAPPFSSIFEDTDRYIGFTAYEIFPPDTDAEK